MTLSAVKVYVRVRPFNLREKELLNNAVTSSEDLITPNDGPCSSVQNMNNVVGNSNYVNKNYVIGIIKICNGIHLTLSRQTSSISSAASSSSQSSSSSVISYRHSSAPSSRRSSGAHQLQSSPSSPITPSSSHPFADPLGLTSSRTFTFDKIFFSPNSDINSYSNTKSISSQESLYNDIRGDLLDHAFEGYNVCLFAYGQTGSGKSYTMMGTHSVKNDVGIIPRACEEIFNRIYESTTSDPSISYTVKLSYIEVSY